MAVGWRCVTADTFQPPGGASGRFYADRGDDLATPAGAVSEEFWVFDPGRRVACRMAVWTPEDVVVLRVTYDEGDVVETVLGDFELELGSYADPFTPTQYRARLISSGTVEIAYTEADPTPKAEFAFFLKRPEATAEEPP